MATEGINARASYRRRDLDSRHSLLSPIRPTSTTRGCQAHSQGLSRLDQGARTLLHPVTSCTHGRLACARAWSGSPTAYAIPSRSTGPGFGQPAQRSQQVSEVASKGRHSSHHPPAHEVPIFVRLHQWLSPIEQSLPAISTRFPNDWFPPLLMGCGIHYSIPHGLPRARGETGVTCQGRHVRARRCRPPKMAASPTQRIADPATRSRRRL